MSMWINEYEHGIDGTSIKPGFIKIGIDNSDTLSAMDQKEDILIVRIIGIWS